MAKQNIKPRIRAGKNLKKGDVFEVKTLVSHDMESGQRKDKKTGKNIPRLILNRLRVTYNGDEVLDAIWHPGVSANPYTSFFVVADKSGPMKFTWTDDAGVAYDKSIQIKVAG
ncbi:MAG: thiosulfate oxidation carrier complex protein SoxZ [Rhodospirillaceae bacterium]|nr:thiosulfate oxidation carrier complex protein SoxZ [Rhodospirillaceae bacterium]